MSDNALEKTKDATTIHVGLTAVSNYKAFLTEPSRPPSKGRNTREVLYE